MNLINGHIISTHFAKLVNVAGGVYEIISLQPVIAQSPLMVLTIKEISVQELGKFVNNYNFIKGGTA
jgi:hypothetical protein